MTEFDKVIPPGGVGKVTAGIHTTNFKGPITKSVTVTTNDPDNRTFTLQIKANVTVPVDVSPSDTVSFAGRYDELKPQELIITSADKSNFDISSMTVGDPTFKATVEAAPETGTAPKPKAGTVASGASRYKLVITPPANPTIGRLNTQIDLKTTHPKAADLPIRIFGNVTGDITYSPSTIMLQTGPSATAEQKTAKVLLQKMTGDPLKITGVTSDNPGIKTSVKTIEEGKQFEITVTYDGAPLTMALNAKVTVATNDKRQPTVEMQVWGRTDPAPVMGAQPAISPAGAAHVTPMPVEVKPAPAPAKPAPAPPKKP